MGKINDVRDFHRKFGLSFPDRPTHLSEEAVNRRIRLIDEEFDEFVEAWELHDYLKQIKELMDLLYVTYGTLVEMGIDDAGFWNAVHHNNMQKQGGTLNEYGKWVKNSDHTPADIRGVFEVLYGPEESIND